jgi:hypothetical protein
MVQKKRQAGGAAMQGGGRYQNQATAWLAAKMLAERPAAPILSRGKLTFIAAESGEAVDDALAGNDLGGSGEVTSLHCRRRNSCLKPHAFRRLTVAH